MILASCPVAIRGRTMSFSLYKEAEEYFCKMLEDTEYINIYFIGKKKTQIESYSLINGNNDM